MKPILFLAAIVPFATAAALAVAQSSAPDSGVDTPQPVGQQYRVDVRGRDAGQCFNGRFIAGANRGSDARTVFVQSGRGHGIFRLELADDCDALNGAQKITLRARGDLVCSGEPAVLAAHTAAGPKRCDVRRVERLTRKEVAALAAATPR